MTVRGKTTQASTPGSWAPHTGSRSRVEPDEGEMLREPSDRDILERRDNDEVDEIVEVDFGPLDWNTDFTAAQRLVLGYVNLDIATINAYRQAGVDDYQTMRGYNVHGLTGPLITAYATQACGANEALELHQKGVTPKAWATYRADDPEITPVEALALKQAKIGKAMFTELRAFGVTDPEQMVAIAKQFSGKDLGVWRRQGVTLADLYNEAGKLETPRPTRLALVREFGLTVEMAEQVGSTLGDNAKLDARVVDRAVKLHEAREGSRSSRWAIAGWAQAETSIELAMRGVAVGANFDDVAVTAANLAGNGLERIVATIERRRTGDRDVDAKTILSTIREFSQVRPLTDSELDDAALLADHSAHNRYHSIIKTAPSGEADDRGFRRPGFDPESMSRLAAIARSTGDPRLFLSNLGDYQRSSLVAEGAEQIVDKAAAAAMIGRSRSEVDRAMKAGAKTMNEVAALYAALDNATSSLGLEADSVGPSASRGLRF